MDQYKARREHNAKRIADVFKAKELHKSHDKPAKPSPKQEFHEHKDWHRPGGENPHNPGLGGTKVPRKPKPTKPSGSAEKAYEEHHQKNMSYNPHKNSERMWKH